MKENEIDKMELMDVDYAYQLYKDNIERQFHFHHYASGNTRLKLKKEWKTPYNHFQIGDNSELQYFAQKLGKTTQQLIDDFENGYLDSWFEKM